MAKTWTLELQKLAAFQAPKLIALTQLNQHVSGKNHLGAEKEVDQAEDGGRIHLLAHFGLLVSGFGFQAFGVGVLEG